MRAELDAILASEHFRSSGRYPALLRYIVEKALQGNIADLKERTIGVEVFHRESHYSTADDPVVRVCGSEVRRRLAQFYQHNGGCGIVQIELPAGGYVPQFRRSRSADEVPCEVPDEANAAHPTLESAAAEEQARDASRSINKMSRFGAKWSVPFAAGLLTALVIVGATLLILQWRNAHSPLAEVWGPLLANSNSVLFSVGRPHPPGESDQDAMADVSVNDHFRQPGFRMSITAASAISTVAGILENNKKQFQIRDADSNGLDDLRHRPVVLINGGDNKWTLLLLQPLRFQIQPRIGTEDCTYINDAEHPQRRDLRVDWNKPYLSQTVDYAIVARFYSPTTDGPVVVIAGVSSNGTEAGGDFMASPEQLAALARNAHSSLTKNFEAVLRVEVVAGKTGAVKIVDSQFW